MTKKRQAQDATRKYDVAPLRARIKALEALVHALYKEHEKRIKALERTIRKG